MSKTDDGKASKDGVFAKKQKTDQQLRGQFLVQFRDAKTARSQRGKTATGVSMEVKLAAYNAMIGFLEAPSTDTLNSLLLKEHRLAFEQGTILPGLMKAYITADMKRMDATHRCDKSALNTWFDSRTEELSPVGSAKQEC